MENRFELKREKKIIDSKTIEDKFVLYQNDGYYVLSMERDEAIELMKLIELKLSTLG